MNGITANDHNGVDAAVLIRANGATNAASQQYRHDNIVAYREWVRDHLVPYLRSQGGEATFGQISKSLGKSGVYLRECCRHAAKSIQSYWLPECVRDGVRQRKEQVIKLHRSLMR